MTNSRTPIKYNIFTARLPH